MTSNEDEIYLIPYRHSQKIKLIYAPARGYVGMCDLPDIIAKESVVSIEKLNENADAGQLIEELKKVPLKDLDIMQKGLPSLNIDLSSGCNMHCIYCYAGRGEGKVRFQRKENINQIIDIYFDHLLELPDKGDGTFPITFANDAEPTYATDLLKYTVKTIIMKAKSVDLKPVFSMPTNGAFSRDMKDLIIEHFSEISFSFEGLPFIQNKHRPLINGSPSFELVYENVKALYDSRLKIGFNVVITSHNLYLMRETVDFFEEHFPGSAISFSPVHLTGRALKEQNELLIDQQVFDNQLMAALNYAKQTSIKVYTKHGRQNLIPRRHYCSSTAKPNWNVSLDGEIYACMEAKHEGTKIGRIDFEHGQLKLDLERIKFLQGQTVDSKSKCHACYAKYLCAGGCVIRGEDNEDPCIGIRQRFVYFINQAYEDKNILTLGRRLFKIDAE